MSKKHPIVAITGASGAGTTVIKRAFKEIFLKQDINAAFIEGENFRRYDREEMQKAITEAESEGKYLSPYGPDVNRFDLLETLFREYSETGTARIRRYISREVAEETGEEEGIFTDWEDLPGGSDLLFYEGLHGGVAASKWSRRRMSDSHNPRVINERRNLGKSTGVDVAQYVDLLIGIVPVVNLEWIQKINSDTEMRGYLDGGIARRLISRMQDYIHFIVPQFSLTDINFQRVPMVDTSNPFVATEIPDDSECAVVVRFREPSKYDFPDLLARIKGSYMSRPNTMLIPGGSMRQALSVICTPLIHDLIEDRDEAE